MNKIITIFLLFFFTKINYAETCIFRLNNDDYPNSIKIYFENNNDLLNYCNLKGITDINSKYKWDSLFNSQIYQTSLLDSVITTDTTIVFILNNNDSFFIYTCSNEFCIKKVDINCNIKNFTIDNSGGAMQIINNVSNITNAECLKIIAKNNISLINNFQLKTLEYNCLDTIFFIQNSMFLESISLKCNDSIKTIKVDNLQQLKQFTLGNSYLYFLDKIDFSQNINLMFLNINSVFENLIEGEKIILPNSDSLLKIELKNNYIDSIYLNNNKNLMYLDLRNNLFTNLDLSENNNLQYLYLLGNNSLANIILPSTFSSLSNVSLPANLSQTTLNNIFILLDTTGTSGGTLTKKSGKGATGGAIINYNNLVSKGWTIINY